ncbi:uncharacterized protein I303_100711 [Kwoniella dejecticola CBS 10117]|uniref:Uncharacterized protein n=1 Tax=Kwoniella dejecticola CBS 10117 TaxID=1296121 RepID=A0A1A6AFR1_9TREE|nr:uncharacterized protein I303_00714 [Kwoniella dejecticola CBS 10117]OBR88896.1 hypothetical protein I303_00714 [Kwoniella dejecticola CBS 10117]
MYRTPSSRENLTPLLPSKGAQDTPPAYSPPHHHTSTPQAGKGKGKGHWCIFRMIHKMCHPISGSQTRAERNRGEKRDEGG